MTTAIVKHKKTGEIVATSYTTTTEGLIKFWHIKHRRYEEANREMFKRVYEVVGEQKTTF